MFFKKMLILNWHATMQGSIGWGLALGQALCYCTSIHHIIQLYNTIFTNLKKWVLLFSSFSWYVKSGEIKWISK